MTGLHVENAVFVSGRIDRLHLIRHRISGASESVVIIYAERIPEDRFAADSVALLLLNQRGSVRRTGGIERAASAAGRSSGFAGTMWT